MLINRAALLRAEQAMGWIQFFEKEITFLFGHGQVQVLAQPGFQVEYLRTTGKCWNTGCPRTWISY